MIMFEKRKPPAVHRLARVPAWRPFPVILHNHPCRTDPDRTAPRVIVNIVDTEGSGPVAEYMCVRCRYRVLHLAPESRPGESSTYVDPVWPGEEPAEPVHLTHAVADSIPDPASPPAVPRKPAPVPGHVRHGHRREAA